MTEEKDDSGGVKVYERPETPPSKVKAIKIVAALVIVLLLAFIAFYFIL